MLFIEPSAVSIQEQINQLIVSVLSLCVPILTAYVTKQALKVRASSRRKQSK